MSQTLMKLSVTVFFFVFCFLFCFVYAVTVFVCVCGYFGVLCMHVSDAYEAVRHFLCLLLFFLYMG